MLRGSFFSAACCFPSVRLRRGQWFCAPTVFLFSPRQQRLLAMRSVGKEISLLLELQSLQPQVLFCFASLRCSGQLIGDDIWLETTVA